jgi:TrmH family RNA methyltransferase
VKQITSRENPAWKTLVRLCHSSRDRRKLGKCVLEGAHAVAAYLERHGPPEMLIVSDAAADDAEIRALAGRVGSGDAVMAPARLFAELAQTATPAGLLAIVPMPQPRSPVPGAFNLILDSIQDPGNLGTMLRSAAAAGVTHAFMSPDCAFAWSPKVLRAAQGAHFYLEIVEGADLPALVRNFTGIRIAAAPRGRIALYDADLRGPAMILIGNEGAGLRPELLEAATAVVTIPMPGGFESLNAASAAAICLYEKVRQERLARP